MAEEYAAVDSRLLTGRNPFRHHFAGPPWDGVELPDVPDLQLPGRRLILQRTAEVAADPDHTSQGLLLLGPTGSGKTHVLHSLPRLLAQIGRRALVAYVPPFTDNRYLFLHLLRCLALDLGRSRPGAARSQLEELVWSVLQTHAEAAIERLSDPATLAERWETSRATFLGDRDACDPFLDKVAEVAAEADPRLARGFLRALLRAATPSLAPRVLEWLRGDDLDPDELATIRAPRPLHDERQAFDAIQSVGRAALPFGPVVLGFDQTESLPARDGLPGMHPLVRAICRLHDECPNLVLVTTCLDDRWEAYTRELTDTERQRVREGEAILGRLTPREGEAAAKLVAARIEQVLRPLAPPFPSYPFRPDYVASVLAHGSFSPRELIVECERRLEAMRLAGRIQELSGADAERAPGPSAERRPVDAVREVWQEELDHARTGGGEIDGDATRDAVLRVLRAIVAAGGGKPLGLTAVDPAADIHDAVIELVLGQGGPRVGIVVTETLNGRRFEVAVRKAREAADDDRIDRAFLVRGEPLKDGWKKGKEEVERLAGKGGGWIQLAGAPRGQLAAVLDLLRRAEAGEIAAGTEVVGGERAMALLAEAGDLAALDLVRLLTERCAGLKPAGGGAGRERRAGRRS